MIAGYNVMQYGPYPDINPGIYYSIYIVLVCCILLTFALPVSPDQAGLVLSLHTGHVNKQGGRLYRVVKCIVKSWKTKRDSNN